MTQSTLDLFLRAPVNQREARPEQTEELARLRRSYLAGEEAMENRTAAYSMTGSVGGELVVDGVTAEAVMSIENEICELEKIVSVIDAGGVIQVDPRDLDVRVHAANEYIMWQNGIVLRSSISQIKMERERIEREIDVMRDEYKALVGEQEELLITFAGL